MVKIPSATALKKKVSWKKGLLKKNGTPRVTFRSWHVPKKAWKGTWLSNDCKARLFVPEADIEAIVTVNSGVEAKVSKEDEKKLAKLMKKNQHKEFLFWLEPLQSSAHCSLLAH